MTVYILLLLYGSIAFAALLTGISWLVLLSGIIALFYLVLMVFKLYVVAQALSFQPVDYTHAELSELTDKELPVFTVLIPLYQEAEVAGQVIEAISALDYPPEKLDVIVTLEWYDDATIDALAHAPRHWRRLILPDVAPKTKPKALNTALREARGKYLVIYDAEIIPDTDQLKKAVLAFRDNPDVACFQTRLDHYNAQRNVLTMLFNLEFSFYYDMFLPGLQKLGYPVPLSGHSTLFRVNALRDVGGWDPYNVAEDCDMGIRLYRYGYHTGVINSVSREEAVDNLSGWIKQRSRWMKGFLQTSLVHLRFPFRFSREIGPFKNTVAFLLSVPGTVFVNLLNLMYWVVLLLWIIAEPAFIKDLYPQTVLYMSGVAFIIGSFIFTYLNLIAAYRRGKFSFVKFGILTPLYWILLAWATSRAVFMLITNPYAWEKTKHGTHLSAPSKKL